MKPDTTTTKAARKPRAVKAPKPPKPPKPKVCNSPHLPYCHACPTQGRHRITPSGPTPADVLLLGDFPSIDDARRREIMVGKAGKELTFQYLPLAQLSRYAIRIANVTRCTQPEHKDPSDKTMAACFDKWCYDEINNCRPRVIVPMSAAACRALDPSISLEYHHGRALPGKVGKWSGTIWPMYHPVAGLGDTGNIQKLREGFKGLGEWLRGEWVGPVDEYAGVEGYTLLETEFDFLDYIYTNAGIDPQEYIHKVAMDTEYVPTRPAVDPVCYSFSLMPGTGAVVMADNRELTKRINQWMGDMNIQITLHNTLADLDPLEHMGITYPTQNPHRVTDTMIKLYNRQLPTGLKVAAYRLLGMHMDEFMVLAREHSRPAALEYLEMAGTIIGPPLRPRIQPVWKKAIAILTKCMLDETTSPWELWSNIPNDQTKPVTDLYGTMPQPSVRHFPMAALIPYACRDADATLRIDDLLDSDRAGKHAPHIPKRSRVPHMETVIEDQTDFTG